MDQEISSFPEAVPIAGWPTRIVAYLVEGVIFALIVLIPVVGPLVAVAYMLGRDALCSGASPAKALLNLRVIDETTRQPIGVRQSVLRNFPLAIGFFLPIIPVIGHILGGGFASFVFFIECTLVLFSSRRRRLGDRFAGTLVVEEIENRRLQLETTRVEQDESLKP